MILNKKWMPRWTFFSGTIYTESLAFQRECEWKILGYKSREKVDEKGENVKEEKRNNASDNLAN